MDDGLLRRLRAEQARALLYDADPHHAVMLACDLLVAGVNGDAVVALAAESARTLPAHDASRRLAAVTAELGLAEPDLPTAVALIATDTCERILDGSIPAEVGTHTRAPDRPLRDRHPHPLMITDGSDWAVTALRDIA